MVSLRQIEYLVTVVDEGTFTRAAALLHVTQPALSHQIQALERSVGATLLERASRGAHLTPAGRAFLPHARAVLSDAANALSAARQSVGLAGGELRLATTYSISLGLLPAALRLWSRRHPDVDIRLYEHRHSDELMKAMAGGQADLAIGPRPSDWTGPIHTLGIEGFVIAVSRDDPLAVRHATEVDLGELRERRWVHYAPDNGLADVLNLACARAAFQPNIAVRTEQTASAPILAAAGLGPALVPANIVPDGYEGYALRPSPGVHRELTAYARTVPDALVSAFLVILKESTRERLSRPAS
ncbi:LysR family transcriptional regulator [Nonomuraea deserti]|jgi:DNA-binding transcriptional LysR family regulator|uniref:LysR family transcriptional regulator n=1 Tax=Nonomuraea deserti TaxID=1848322 RepID=A0A4R4VBP1_9ACTN|nr:LysR family transcriptional regulator [Nonomuraea deserti]TDD02572.1 LysR family transcriptional regulator [Nonomuraea deserti]